MGFIDNRGVQRFEANRIVSDLVDHSTDTLNLFEIEMSYQNGAYSVDEYIEFSVLHGCSVSELCDLSFMEGVTVENPVWEDTQFKLVLS